jgi:hypothetical protein
MFFPDRSAAQPQVWEVAWEGLLVSQRASGNIMLPAAKGDPAVLHDGGFCGGGVVKGDIVTLNGCTNDSQCPLGAVCHKDPTVDQVPGGFTVTGLCVSPETHKSDTCTPLAGTLRRYEIVSAQDGQLQIKPRLDEVIRSNLSPCRFNPTGGAGGGGAARERVAPAAWLARAAWAALRAHRPLCSTIAKIRMIRARGAWAIEGSSAPRTRPRRQRCRAVCIRAGQDGLPGRARLEIPQPIMKAARWMLQSRPI